MKPLVYMAGPYSNPDPIANMRDAMTLATKVIDDGRAVPIVPHLSGIWDLVTPKPYEWWLQYDFELVARCDAVFRMTGDSAGADREIAFAEELEIPVFYTLGRLYHWCDAFAELMPLGDPR